MTIADLLSQHLVGRYIILHDYSLTEGLVPEHFKINTEKELLVIGVDLADKNVVIILQDGDTEIYYLLRSVDELFIKIKPR